MTRTASWKRIHRGVTPHHATRDENGAKTRGRPRNTPCQECGNTMQVLVVFLSVHSQAGIGIGGSACMPCAHDRSSYRHVKRPYTANLDTTTSLQRAGSSVSIIHFVVTRQENKGHLVTHRIWRSLSRLRLDDKRRKRKARKTHTVAHPPRPPQHI